MKFQKPRGTLDIYDINVQKYSTVEKLLRCICTFYNYQEIKTPTFESTDLYIRSVGNSSDIVTKEIYQFKDRSLRDLSLRPEGTAGTLRAVIENKLIESQQLPLKLFYLGSMFRYERPQNNRTREFLQFGVECIGSNNITSDLEIITFAYQILTQLGNLKNFKLEINNIGDSVARNKWSEDLKQYLQQYKDQLSDESVQRLQTNPLRIIDDKVDGKKAFINDIPKLCNYLTPIQNQYFNDIKKGLEQIGIKYSVNNNLVRGLDYYNGIVFEFINTNINSDQSTIIGGGRYDSLLKELGGVDSPAIGFGLGIERLIRAMDEEKVCKIESQKLDVFLITLTPKAKFFNQSILAQMRFCGLKADTDFFDKKLPVAFKIAKKMQAHFIVIIGDKELQTGKVTIKDEISHNQQELEMDKLIDFLVRNKKGEN